MALLTLVLLGAGSLLVLGGGGGSAKGGGPKRTAVPVAGYTPATLRSTAPAAQRSVAPSGLSWREFSGEVEIASIRRPNREAKPGYDVLDLAEVYSGNDPVRVYVDAFVVDNRPGVGSTLRAVANVSRVHYNSGPTLDASVAVEQAERIVRDFSASNAGLIEGEQTTELVEHNEPDPPRIPAFYGDACRIGHVSAEDSLYHMDDCRGTTRERAGKPEQAYPDGRTFGLSLEVRADGNVYLVARVMRLPARQTLTWRAYAASEKR